MQPEPPQPSRWSRVRDMMTRNRFKGVGEMVDASGKEMSPGEVQGEARFPDTNTDFHENPLANVDSPEPAPAPAPQESMHVRRASEPTHRPILPAKRRYEDPLDIVSIESLEKLLKKLGVGFFDKSKIRSLAHKAIGEKLTPFDLVEMGAEYLVKGDEELSTALYTYACLLKDPLESTTFTLMPFAPHQASDRLYHLATINSNRPDDRMDPLFVFSAECGSLDAQFDLAS